MIEANKCKGNLRRHSSGVDEVIKTVKDFHEMKLQTTSDFEAALGLCFKEDLIEFIIMHQSRGCFKGIIHN